MMLFEHNRRWHAYRSMPETLIRNLLRRDAAFQDLHRPNSGYARWPKRRMRCRSGVKMNRGAQRQPI